MHQAMPSGSDVLKNEVWAKVALSLLINYLEESLSADIQILVGI